MHDDDITSQFELCSPKQIAETPIQFLTLSDIITHLWGRYDAIAVSAMNEGDELPILSACLGSIKLRQVVLDHLHEIEEITPAETDGDDSGG